MDIFDTYIQKFNSLSVYFCLVINKLEIDYDPFSLMNIENSEYEDLDYQTEKDRTEHGYQLILVRTTGYKYKRMYKFYPVYLSANFIGDRNPGDIIFISQKERFSWETDICDSEAEKFLKELFLTADKFKNKLLWNVNYLPIIFMDCFLMLDRIVVQSIEKIKLVLIEKDRNDKIFQLLN